MQCSSASTSDYRRATEAPGRKSRVEIVAAGARRRGGFMTHEHSCTRVLDSSLIKHIDVKPSHSLVTLCTRGSFQEQNHVGTSPHGLVDCSYVVSGIAAALCVASAIRRSHRCQTSIH